MLNKIEVLPFTPGLRILSVDPSPVILYGLRQFIHQAFTEIELYEETGRLSELPELISQHQPDIVIMELMSNGGSVLDALRIINTCTRNRPEISIVICTTLQYRSLFQVLRLMNVRGIYLKEEPIDILLQCLNQTLIGCQGFSPMVIDTLPDTISAGNSLLTGKELEVLLHLFSGKNVTTIARLMQRDVRTISSHKRRAMRKIGFKNDSEIFSNAYWMMNS